MSTHYNSQTDKLDIYNEMDHVNAIIICILGLAVSIVVHYHITGAI